MTARQSSATDRALRLLAKGVSKGAAARKAGIAYSTLWRALKRLQHLHQCEACGFKWTTDQPHAGKCPQCLQGE